MSEFNLAPHGETASLRPRTPHTGGLEGNGGGRLPLSVSGGERMYSPLDHVDRRTERAGVVPPSMKRIWQWLVLLAVLLTLALCVWVRQPHSIRALYSGGGVCNSAKLCLTANCVAVAHDLIAPMNFSADRCADPYAASCGNFLATGTIPEWEDTWALLFDGITESNKAKLTRMSTSYSCARMKQMVSGSAPPEVEVSSGHRLDAWDAMYHCAFESCSGRRRTDSLDGQPLVNFVTKQLPFLLHVAYDVEDGQLGPDERRRVLSHRLAQLDAAFGNGVFAVGNVPNMRESSDLQVPYVGQPDLGLQYKFWEEASIVRAWRELLREVLLLFNRAVKDASLATKNANLDVDIDQRVDAIIDLQWSLRNISSTPEELRDVQNSVVKIDFQTLRAMAPAIDFDVFFGESMTKFAPFYRLSDAGVMYADSQTYLARLSDLILAGQRLPVKWEGATKWAEVWNWRTIHDYMLVQVLLDSAYLLGRDWRSAVDKKNEKILGVKPRHVTEYCISHSPLKWVIARRFVKEVGASRTKVIAEDMISFLRDVLRDNMSDNDWMDAATRERAVAKLDAMDYKISHPSWLLEDADIRFTRWFGDPTPLRVTTHFEGVVYLSIMARRERYWQMGQPKDKEAWSMVPQLVNAYYHPFLNEIAFPAAILMPPAMYSWSDDAPEVEKQALRIANFAGIGAVIAHELTHGFDDMGRHYAADGSLTDWWTPETTKKFREKAKCLEDQYSAYYIDITEEEEGGMSARESRRYHLNGNLGLGENIADNGGVRLAFQGWQRRAGGFYGDSDTPLPGLNMTGKQLFFAVYGRVWCRLYRDKAYRTAVLTGPHSVSKFRVNGVLENDASFYNSFACTNAPKPEDQCRVW